MSLRPWRMCFDKLRRHELKYGVHRKLLQECCQTNANSSRSCQNNENTHRIAGTAYAYAINNCRHSARAVAQFSLKLMRE